MGMPLPWTQSFMTPPTRSLPPPSTLPVAPNLIQQTDGLLDRGRLVQLETLHAS